MAKTIPITQPLLVDEPDESDELEALDDGAGLGTVDGLSRLGDGAGGFQLSGSLDSKVMVVASFVPSDWPAGGGVLASLFFEAQTVQVAGGGEPKGTS
jgi:hypothetical protein